MFGVNHPAAGNHCAGGSDVTLTKGRSMTQINDPKLKPCPFCGEDAAIWYYPASARINRKDSYYVGCTNDNCGCEMEHSGGWKTYDDAVNAWNRRSNG